MSARTASSCEKTVRMPSFEPDGEHFLHAFLRFEVGSDRHHRASAVALVDGDDHGRDRVPVVRAAVVVNVGIP